MYVPTMFFGESGTNCISTDLQPINYTYYSGSIPFIVNYFEGGTSGSFDVFADLQDVTLLAVGQGGYGNSGAAGGAGGVILSSSLAIKDGEINRDWERNRESITLSEGLYNWRVSEAKTLGSDGNTTFGSFTAIRGGYQIVTALGNVSIPDGGSGGSNGTGSEEQGYDGGTNSGGGASNSGSADAGGDGIFHPWFRGTLGQDTFTSFGAPDRNQPGGWFAGGGGGPLTPDEGGLGGGGDRNSDATISGSGAGGGKGQQVPDNHTQGATGGIWLAYPISQFCPTIENLPTGSSGYRVRFYNDDYNVNSPYYVQYQPHGSSSYEGIEVPSRTGFPLDVCIESGSTYYTGSDSTYTRIIEVGDCDVYSSSYCECTTVTFTAGVGGGTGSFYPCGEGQSPGFDREDTQTNRLLSGSEVFTTCIVSGSSAGITGAGAQILFGSVCTSSISLCN